MKVEGRGRGRWHARALTCDGALLFLDPRFVAASERANRFVAGGDGDHAEQRDDEGEGGADVPPAEDDAQVGCVPGEEHLR